MIIKIIDYYKNINIFLIIIIIFIFSLSFYFHLFVNIKVLFYFIQSEIDLLRNENIFKLSNNCKLKLFKKFKKNNNPKISIISPVYNSEKFILRFLKSIQIQNFIEIEIIFIDDCSNDNSYKIIKNYQNEDKRIILIRNKKNKGTFINRNIGVLYSKGKYIILPDPDDILTNNILNICYKFNEKYKIEMIRFNIYIGNGKRLLNNIIEKINFRPIKQPELSTYLYYGNNEFDLLDGYLTNKFIKKEVYIRALNSLNNYYLNIYITFMEDSLFNYILYRTAKSFIFLKRDGYYYIKNRESITHNLDKIDGLRITFIFIFIKTIFEFSKNTQYEKDITNFLITHYFKYLNIKQRLSNRVLNNNIHLLHNIINIFLNSSYLNKLNKNLLLYLKKGLIKKANINTKYIKI